MLSRAARDRSVGGGAFADRRGPGDAERSASRSRARFAFAISSRLGRAEVAKPRFARARPMAEVSAFAATELTPRSGPPAGLIAKYCSESYGGARSSVEMKDF